MRDRKKINEKMRHSSYRINDNDNKNNNKF